MHRIERKRCQYGRDDYLVCDVPGLIELSKNLSEGHRNSIRGEWYGGMGYSQTMQALEYGDESIVAKSDELLDKIEGLVPLTRTFQTIASVAGGQVNVPLMLTGNPYHMRQRRRVNSVQAPLAIFIELSSSCGVTAEDMLNRGVCLFAMARHMAAIRPVELYATVCLGRTNYAANLICRIDTAPLNLGQAAHILSHPSVGRGLGYKLLDTHCDTNSWSGCAFGSLKLERETSSQRYREVVNPTSEPLYIPMIHNTDEYLNDPVAWLNTMIARHGGLMLAS